MEKLDIYRQLYETISVIVDSPISHIERKQQILAAFGKDRYKLLAFVSWFDKIPLTEDSERDK